LLIYCCINFFCNTPTNNNYLHMFQP
jgi:hypothetical protein